MPNARQHYAEANAPKKPRPPTWLKIAALVACLGLAGGLADANAAKTAGAQQVEKKPGKR